MLQELGMEGLEERLSSATQNPASPAYRLSRMVTEVTQMQVSPATAPSPQFWDQLCRWLQLFVHNCACQLAANIYIPCVLLSQPSAVVGSCLGTALFGLGCDSNNSP